MVQTTTTPPNQLNPIAGIRKLEDRGKFQWKLVFKNGTEKEFKNFRELQRFANHSLMDLNQLIILTRSDRREDNC